MYCGRFYIECSNLYLRVTFHFMQAMHKSIKFKEDIYGNKKRRSNSGTGDYE